MIGKLEESSANWGQIIERSLSDIGYVTSLEGRLREIVTEAYVKCLTYTHGKSIPASCLLDTTLIKSQAFRFSELWWRSQQLFVSESIDFDRGRPPLFHSFNSYRVHNLAPPPRTSKSMVITRSRERQNVGKF